MVDITEEIRKILTTETNDPSKPLPTLKITAGVLPTSPEEGIGMRLNDGASPTRFFGQQEVIQYPLVQMTIRCKKYGTGDTDAKRICDILKGYHDTNFLAITQVGNVMHLGRDTNNLHEFVLNFRTMIQ